MEFYFGTGFGAANQDAFFLVVLVTSFECNVMDGEEKSRAIVAPYMVYDMIIR